MDAEAQKLMKDSLLQALVREPQYALLSHHPPRHATVTRDMVLMLVCVRVRACAGSVHRKPVRNGIADVVGIVARITVPSNAWPELLDFLFQCTNSQNVEHREVGMKLFDSLTDNIGDILRPHTKTLYNIFAKGLTDSDNNVRVASLKCVNASPSPDAFGFVLHLVFTLYAAHHRAVGSLVDWVTTDEEIVRTLNTHTTHNTHNTHNTPTPTPHIMLRRKRSATCCRRCSTFSATASRTDSTTKARVLSKFSTNSSNRYRSPRTPHSSTVLVMQLGLSFSYTHSFRCF
jgi:hypothetical protein